MIDGDRRGEVSSGRAPAERPQSWPETWVRALMEIGSVSPQRRATVLKDIQIGSRPTIVYYVLLGLSELIAGFALIVDSDATLIDLFIAALAGLAGGLGEPVDLTVRARTEIVVTGTQYRTVEQLRAQEGDAR